MTPDERRRSRSSATSRPRGCAAPAWSTRWPAWSRSGCWTPRAGSCPTEQAAARRARPGRRLTMLGAGAGVRAALARRARRRGRLDLPVPARRPGAAVRQGGHRHGLEHPAGGGRAGRPATSSRCCWPARSAATCPRPARSSSAWCPKLPALRVVSAGNVAGEGAKMALLSVRERAGALALLQEVRYVELSDRADFNDAFVDQLAFPALTGAANRDHRVRGAGRARARDRRPAGLAGRGARPARAAAQPPGAGSPRRPESWPASSARGLRVALAYADCGTYGALDELCAELGLARLGGLHCYDVLGGPDRIAALLAAEPGTYLLTDFLVRSFDRTVLAGAGPGPPPRAVAGLLRPLPAAGLAGPGQGRRAGPGRGGDRRAVRPAAHRHRHRHRRAGAASLSAWWPGRRAGAP